MGSLSVVERKVRAEPASQLTAGLVSFEVNVFVFDAPPETLDKDVVDPAALAVHADLDPRGFQFVDPVVARKLRSLIRVEDLRCTVPGQRIL